MEVPGISSVVMKRKQLAPVVWVHAPPEQFGKGMGTGSEKAYGFGGNENSSLSPPIPSYRRLWTSGGGNGCWVFLPLDSQIKNTLILWCWDWGKNEKEDSSLLPTQAMGTVSFGPRFATPQTAVARFYQPPPFRWLIIYQPPKWWLIIEQRQFKAGKNQKPKTPSALDRQPHH